MNLALKICGILFGVIGLACFILPSVLRLRPRVPTGLHPLVFTGFGLGLAANICYLLRSQCGGDVSPEALSCFVWIFAMVGIYVRTYFGTWKDRHSPLSGPPVV